MKSSILSAARSSLNVVWPCLLKYSLGFMSSLGSIHMCFRSYWSSIV